MDGTAHSWAYNAKLGAAISLFVGFFSSVLGIGGGINQVPVLAYMLNLPILIATATTQFVLIIMSLAGVVTHIVVGDFTSGWRRLTVLTMGVIIGTQLGAYLSKRVRGDWIIRGVALTLGLVGLRVLFLALSCPTVSEIGPQSDFAPPPRSGEAETPRAADAPVRP